MPHRQRYSHVAIVGRRQVDGDLIVRCRRAHLHRTKCLSWRLSTQHRAVFDPALWDIFLGRILLCSRADARRQAQLCKRRGDDASVCMNGMAAMAWRTAFMMLQPAAAQTCGAGPST